MYLIRGKVLKSIITYPNLLKNINYLIILPLSWPKWVNFQIRKSPNFHRFIAKLAKFCNISYFFGYFRPSDIGHVIYCQKRNFKRNLNVMIIVRFEKVGNNAMNFFL